MLRFASERSIFDLVGQQVLAQSFLRDGFLDASVGATHYLVKLFLVYIPFGISSLDPRWSLIIMTLLINIAAYIAIFFAIKSILRTFDLLRPKIFYVAMVWLAASAGSIFWIEFANSRNLEVAVGLWTIVLGLNFIKNPNVRRGVMWLSIATLAFFMDPLQIYMTGLPLAIYLIVVELLPRLANSWKKHVGSVIAILGGAYVCSKVILAIVVATTGTVVISDSSSALGTSNIIMHLSGAIKGLVIADVRLVAGVVGDGGRLRQGLALLAVLFALFVWVAYAVRKKVSRKLVAFVLIFSCVIQGIYFLSGQSLNGDTSRYLIMFAPILVLVISSLPMTRLSRAALLMIAIFVTVTGLFLSLSLLRAWPERFTKDRPLATVAEFIQGESQTRFYASMDTALPVTYYYPSTTILPLRCSPSGLERSATFYPKGSFDTYQSKSRAQVGIIFDAEGNITNHPNVCNKDDVIKRFGQPQQIQMIAGGQLILFYDAGRVSF